MHCDIDQVGSIDNIRAALTELGAQRLDHGTNIVEDPSLVAYARDHGIGLTSCPLSNSFVTDEMKGKEIVELTAAGVKVSINSDDPAYFGGYIGDNYLALAERFDLGRADLERIARNSIDIAWIPDEQKKAMHARIDSSSHRTDPAGARRQGLGSAPAPASSVEGSTRRTRATQWTVPSQLATP